MRLPILAVLVAAGSLPALPALALDGAPASPSGAPAAAAQHGSSMAGAAAAKNEMRAHDENEARQKTMDDPHESEAAKTAH